MLFQASTFLALIAAAVAQSLTVNTPASVVQCQPAQLTWTATSPPVFLSIIPGGQPGATALQDFGQQSGTSFTWTVNIAAGTSITVQVRDSTGAVAYSAPVTIQSSSDSSCLGQQPSTAAPSSAAPSSAAPSSAAPSSAATTPVTSAPVTSAQATSSSAAVSISSVASSAASSVSSVVSSATAPGTTARPSSSSHASVVSSATRSGSASGAAPTSTNGAMPTAKVGLAGLLGLAAAVVMA